MTSIEVIEWGCSSVGRGSLDRHAANAGLIASCGKGFFSQSPLSVETLLWYLHIPIGNLMHPRLGSMTVSQLAFPGEGNLNFPWEKSHCDSTVVKKL